MPQVPGTSLNSIPATTFDDSGMIPPQGSWWDVFTKPYINPQTGQPELLGSPDTSAEAARNTPWWLGKGGFWPTLLYSTLYPTSTASNDTIPPPTPFQQPAHPSTMRYPGWPTPPVSTPAAALFQQPARPVTPTPTDVPKPPVKPVKQPARPVTPTPAVAAPAPSGMYALGGQTRAIGSGRNPLAYDPYYQGFRT